jgi:hypothetical protein
MSTFTEVLGIYAGSDGEKTKALYARLDQYGAPGKIATNLLRACKASERAKVYRGGDRRRGSFRGLAYDKKEWSLNNLCDLLIARGDQAELRWGWKIDEAATFHRYVLYVDLPTGQVSFHAAIRGNGPDYPGEWDGQRGQSPTRICRFAADLLDGLAKPVEVA